jgi:CRP/FNR family transcriptional regulator, cyclic AMP receptor protein
MDSAPDHLLSKFRDQVELFSEFNNEEILTVLKISSDKLTLSEGEIIFREGSPGNKMFVILAGEVSITRSLGLEGEEELARLGHGQIFGEMGLIDAAPRSARATVIVNNTILLVISDSSLRSLNGELIYKFYKNFSSLLARRLRAANEQTTRLAASERILTLQVKRITATDSHYNERLRGADLKGADLTQADLKRSDLRGSVFVGSTFKETNFRECSFRGADLQESQFTDTDLRNCDFTGADLRGSVFRGTNLDESKFSSAQVESMRIVAEIGSDVAEASTKP